MTDIQMTDIQKYNNEMFENIKHVNEYGQEFWYARELQKVLEYTQWRNFINSIEKAKIACEKSGNEVNDHFADASKMISLAKGATREINDIMLSRYACYLIVQNGDPRKEVIALGQSYFALQTQRQEKQDKFEQLDEDDKRLAIREELKNHNKKLFAAAKNAGVETQLEFGVFQNMGYQGLYGGLGKNEIHVKKKLKKSHQIMEYMGSTELAANLFRATQTEEKLKRDGVYGKENANRTHFKVGKKVRDTIEDLGGTMPEDLPTPEKSIKKIEKEKINKLKESKE